MRRIAMVAIAAGLATLAACSKDAANNTDNAALTEGIEINQDAVNADINAGEANALDANAVNTIDVDANAANADASAAANNAQ